MQRSDRPVAERAARYTLSEATARKGRRRRPVEDRWSARHPLPSALDTPQKARVAGLRRDVGLSLNDIVEVMRRGNAPTLSRRAI